MATTEFEVHEPLIGSKFDRFIAMGNRFCLREQKDHAQYMHFLERQTAVSVIFAVSCLVTASFLLLMIASILGRASILGIVARAIRFAVSLGMWVYMYVKYWRGGHILPSNRATDTYIDLSYLSNQIILWSAVAGGLILIDRSMQGRCTDEHDYTSCNSLQERNGLPPETTLLNFVSIVFFPMILKAHSIHYVVLSYTVMTSFIVAAAVISKVKYDIFGLMTMSIWVGIVLYDYERTMLNLYRAQHVSGLYDEEATRAVKLKREVDIENDNLCSLISNVAHDLKTPLQSFMSEINNLESLLQSAFRGLSFDLISSEASKQQNEIQNTISSLKNIYSFMMLAINRGIDYRKAISGLALQARHENFLVADAVTWAVSRFADSPTEVGVCMIPSPDNVKMCPMIISDKHWFSDNILSLVLNAMKFTSEGMVEVKYSLAVSINQGAQLSSTVVYASVVSDMFRSIYGEEYDESKQMFVLVLVQDSGIGIPPDKMSILFQPFRQAQRQAGGTGLGLFSISKRMEALHGYCGVQGREDGKRGACFWLAYPYVPDWESGREDKFRQLSNTLTLTTLESRKKEESVTTASNTIIDSLLSLLLIRPPPENNFFPYSFDHAFWRRVLVVEDSVLILKAIKRFLKNEGFDVTVAQNGADGLEKMKQRQYVIVLSDIQMPIMDGKEMVKALREHESVTARDVKDKFKRQFVVGMSANSDADTETEALASGMNCFVPKPLSKSLLKNCLLSEYICNPKVEDDIPKVSSACVLTIR